MDLGLGSCKKWNVDHWVALAVAVVAAAESVVALVVVGAVAVDWRDRHGVVYNRSTHLPDNDEALNYHMLVVARSISALAVHKDLDLDLGIPQTAAVAAGDGEEDRAFEMEIA